MRLFRGTWKTTKMSEGQSQRIVRAAWVSTRWATPLSQEPGGPGTGKRSSGGGAAAFSVARHQDEKGREYARIRGFGEGLTRLDGCRGFCIGRPADALGRLCRLGMDVGEERRGVFPARGIARGGGGPSRAAALRVGGLAAEKKRSDDGWWGLRGLLQRTQAGRRGTPYEGGKNENGGGD